MNRSNPPARPGPWWSFSQGRPILISWSGRPATAPAGACRACGGPMRSGSAAQAQRPLCPRCDHACRHAERLGVEAGRRERRALGLDEPRGPHPALARTRSGGDFASVVLHAPAGCVRPGADGGGAERRSIFRCRGFRALLLLVAAMGFPGLAPAGTLTGKFTLPNTSLPAAHATLTLTLSQAGIVPGSFAIVPSPVVCYTTVNGAITGLPDPTAAPILTDSEDNGSLPAGTYFVEVTTYNATGESLPSPEAMAVLPAPGALAISAPALPTGASYGVYIGTASGAETRQAISNPGGPYLQSIPLNLGAAPPSSNTSPCQFAFNDAILPAPTYYVATLTDAAGDTYAGFPQNWYLTGSTADVSQIYPLATPLPVHFLTPIFANPATNAAQSINSNLNLNGYAIDNTGNLGPGLLSLFWSGSLPAPSSALAQWTPNTAIVVRRLSASAQTPGNGGTTGAVFALSSAQGTCSFPALLPAATGAGSSGAGTGSCSFAAGVPISLVLSADDHATRPANVNFILEFTAQ
ncbi:MAG: hypothetical protein ACRD2E_12425 [Terriglobales bacterium]